MFCKIVSLNKVYDCFSFLRYFFIIQLTKVGWSNQKNFFIQLRMIFLDTIWLNQTNIKVVVSYFLLKNHKKYFISLMLRAPCATFKLIEKFCYKTWNTHFILIFFSVETWNVKRIFATHRKFFYSPKYLFLL